MAKTIIPKHTVLYKQDDDKLLVDPVEVIVVIDVFF